MYIVASSTSQPDQTMHSTDISGDLNPQSLFPEVLTE